MEAIEEIARFRDFKERFDIVFSNATLHWVKDHRRMLRNVRGALRPGGRLQMADILLEEGVTPEEVARYENWHRKRLCIRPGITGYWQVSGKPDRVREQVAAAQKCAPEDPDVLIASADLALSQAAERADRKNGPPQPLLAATASLLHVAVLPDLVALVVDRPHTPAATHREHAR